jgi:hypothetical protein
VSHRPPGAHVCACSYRNFSCENSLISINSAKVQCDVLNVYWNSGGRAIEDFLKEHLTECKGKNWVCDRLGVLNPTIFNDHYDVDTEDQGLTSDRGVSKKPTLSLMLG